MAAKKFHEPIDRCQMNLSRHTKHSNTFLLSHGVRISGNVHHQSNPQAGPKHQSIHLHFKPPKNRPHLLQAGPKNRKSHFSNGRRRNRLHVSMKSPPSREMIQMITNPRETVIIADIVTAISAESRTICCTSGYVISKQRVGEKHEALTEN